MILVLLLTGSKLVDLWLPSCCEDQSQSSVGRRGMAWAGTKVVRLLFLTVKHIMKGRMCLFLKLAIWFFCTWCNYILLKTSDEMHLAPDEFQGLVSLTFFSFPNYFLFPNFIRMFLSFLVGLCLDLRNN